MRTLAVPIKRAVACGMPGSHRIRAHLSVDTPLLGATVVVTRPTASAAPLKRGIVKKGGTPLGLPGISLRAAANPAAAQAALKSATDADAVVFTSPSAVRYAFALRPKLRFPRTAHVFAIGAASARALHRHGVRDVLHPTVRQDSEGLLELPELQKIRRNRIAIVGAPGGRDTLSTVLRQRGARIVDVFVYERSAPIFDRRHFNALENATAPIVTLLSSLEALHHLRDRLPLRLFARLADGDLIVSSERIAAAARASLFANVHIAASADAHALIDAACSALVRHRI